MDKPVNVALGHIWWSILISAIGPGGIAAVIEYFRTGGDVGTGPTLVAFLAGLVVAVILLSLKVRELSLSGKLAQTTEGASGEHEDAVEAGHNPLGPYRLDTARSWCHFTTQELFGKVHGLTDVRAKEVVETEIGKSLRIRGTIRNVRNNDGRITAAINLPNDVMVMLRTESKPWTDILLALQIRDEIEAFGPIVAVDSNGFITMTVEQLLPPNILN